MQDAYRWVEEVSEHKVGAHWSEREATLERRMRKRVGHVGEHFHSDFQPAVLEHHHVDCIQRLSQTATTLNNEEQAQEQQQQLLLLQVNSLDSLGWDLQSLAEVFDSFTAKQNPWNFQDLNVSKVVSLKVQYAAPRKIVTKEISFPAFKKLIKIPPILLSTTVWIPHARNYRKKLSFRNGLNAFSDTKNLSKVWKPTWELLASNASRTFRDCL